MPTQHFSLYVKTKTTLNTYSAVEFSNYFIVESQTVNMQLKFLVQLNEYSCVTDP